MTQTKLYFEAHITVRPPSDHQWQWDSFVNYANLVNWRASRFDVDEVDHYDGAWFLSARGQNYDDLLQDIRVQKNALERAGYEFIRAKIEDTLFDTKHGGIL